MAKFLTERGSLKSRQIDGVPPDPKDDHHDLHHDLTGFKGLQITKASQIPDRLLKFQTTTPLWEQERRQGDNIQQRSVLIAEKKLDKSERVDEEDRNFVIEAHEEGTLAPGLPGMSTTERRIPIHYVKMQDRKEVEKILHQQGMKVAADDIPFFQILPKETSKFLEPAFSIAGKHVEDRDEEGDDEIRQNRELRRSLVQEQVLDDEDDSGSRSMSGSSGEISNPEAENEVSELGETPAAESMEPETRSSMGSSGFEPEEEISSNVEEAESLPPDTPEEEEEITQFVTEEPVKVPAKPKSQPKSKPSPKKNECQCQETDFEDPALHSPFGGENGGTPSFDMEKFNERFEETKAFLCEHLVNRVSKYPSVKPDVVPGTLPSKSPSSLGPPPEPLPEPQERNCECGLKGCGCYYACQCNCSYNQRKRHCSPTLEATRIQVEMEMTTEEKKTVPKPRPVSTKIAP